MIDIKQVYSDQCKQNNIKFDIVESVLSYNDSTFFCPAGMQKYKTYFGSKSGETIANIQKCIRLNDFDELSDGIHALSFDMIGLFSFSGMTVQETVKFFLDFIDKLEVKLSYVTIHPERWGWNKFYPKNLQKREDLNCTWSDGGDVSYCTEFFVEKDGKEVEIGNIVNPLESDIDVGFGLQRLDYIVNDVSYSELDQLRIAATDIINSGIAPSARKHGYVLRKIIRRIISLNGVLDHKFFKDELKRQEAIEERYKKLLPKYAEKDKNWWWETHGINLDDIKTLHLTNLKHRL